MTDVHSIDWQLVLCGLNHKTSSLADREPLQIGQHEIAAAHSLLASLPGVLETVIVSTCNRVEFYLVAETKFSPFQMVQTFYRRFRSVDIEPLRNCFYVSSGAGTAKHLFNVAAGIDSMVLGENQIVGQIRDAYRSACTIKCAGKIMHRLFHQAFRAGKQVRTDTEMGKGACSVSSAAVSLLRSRLETMDQPAVLFLGINQMISLAAKNIRQLGIESFLFANRTPAKAVEFARRYGGSGHSLDELDQLLPRADVLISCTGAAEPVVSCSNIDVLLAAAPKSRLLIMDMAIPRDVAVTDDYDDRIEVHDLESIQEFVRDQQKRREAALPEAEIIIDRKLAEFAYWYEHVLHEPVYNGLKESFEIIRRQEFDDLVKVLPAEIQRDVEERSRRMANRLLKLKIRQSTD
jgi:glutamyl-tRNA reductase